MARFSILLSEGAQRELRDLKASDRKRVIEAIKKHLTDRPSAQEGAKKVLRGLKPPWVQVKPVWQLTVVPFRVFYDVDDERLEVVIQAVRKKPSGKSTEEIL